MNQFDPQIIEKINQLKKDFVFRCETFYKIRPKTGGAISFKLNFAQKYLHEKLEDMKKRKGRIRAVILKARQQGVSTYVAARYFDKVLFNAGLKAFILAHREDATNNLYGLVERYYQNLPEELKRIKLEDNAKRLVFDNDSGYGVGTAGSGEIGRSDTIQLLHMSEAAFYENGAKLMTGIMQTVPELDNTEIIIESTANGTANMFYELCVPEEGMQSDFEVIFIPWFWDKDYRLALTKELLLDSADLQYQKEYELSDEQMNWRQSKIALFNSLKKETGISGIVKFCQEYPACESEAFSATIESELVDRDTLARVFDKKEINETARIIIGVDIAGSGKDKSVFCIRKGRIVLGFLEFRGLLTDALVQKIVELIQEYKPVKVFIDKGYNPGVFDRLTTLRWGDIVVGVDFQGRADEEKYGNKRAEMYFRGIDWIENQPNYMPYNKSFIEDICMQQRLPPDSSGKIRLRSKDDIRKKLKRSPDYSDAWALTYAYNVFLYEDLEEEYEEENNYRQGDLITGY
jgi:hypothetical protein